MSEADHSNGASEGNQEGVGTPNPGSTDEGATGGTQQSSDSFDAVVEQAEERFRRSLQSYSDKSDQRFAELQARLDAAGSGGDEGNESSEEVKPLTLADLRAEVQRERAITRSAETIRKEFPRADPNIYEELDRFDSPEALRAAAEASHQRIEALVAPVIEAKEADLRAKYSELYGELPPVTTEGSSATGEPSLEQLGRMTQPQLDALEAEHGDGYIERIIQRSAN